MNGFDDLEQFDYRSKPVVTIPANNTEQLRRIKETKYNKNAVENNNVNVDNPRISLDTEMVRASSQKLGRTDLWLGRFEKTKKIENGLMIDMFVQLL